ncbi:MULTISPECIES: hypothetical protein [Pseudomonas]|uniref:hypothetical protein n=1 Tax=Pseudomonas TaxID=286 RepID=UPI00059E80B0|nr:MULTISPECIES: hypothetical protein [Pseudomonas]MBB4055093.1 hypothetical protein [Pseudomonas koreensis]TSB49301.1 hypothetical protein FEE99_25720 [Pseudomonas sp. ef1]
MIYNSVLGGVVSALAAEAIDNTSKQAWQKLYSPHEEEQRDLLSLFRCAPGERIDRAQADCWVAARLHHGLEKKHMNALVAKFSTDKAKKIQAITELRQLINSPAPQLFIFKAVTAWAVPKLKGADPKSARTVTVTVPVDARDWRRESMIASAVAVERSAKKRIESRSASMIVLPKSFYDMNTWDTEGRPESTRREWRRNIYGALNTLVDEALCLAGEIFDIEGLIISADAA